MDIMMDPGDKGVECFECCYPIADALATVWPVSLME